MTELEYIEIEGFKGLEHVEFEPTDINLITGRNNTGKTSLLEAMELSSNLKEIRDFDEKASALIKRGFSEAVVETEIGPGANELVIRPATADEAERYLREALTEHIRSSIRIGIKHDEERNTVSLSSFLVSSIDISNKLDEKLHETISKVLTRSVEEIPKSLTLVNLVVELNGEDYPYIYFDNGEWWSLAELSSIFEEVIQNVFTEEVVEKHADSYVVHDPNKENQTIEFDTGYSYVLRGGHFLREPPEPGDINFVTCGELTNKIEDTDDESQAVRVDDIGDFIEEKGIVAELKTFNLETLIFETEDGEKQPVPYEFMGDGFKAMVGLLWELMDDDVEDQIILLEEPETHMHPGYIREVVYFLINLAREEDVQLFITTHDSDFINDFFTENLTDEEEAYLEDEFTLLRMEEDSAVVEDYETARENLKDLHLDLRGI